MDWKRPVVCSFLKPFTWDTWSLVMMIANFSSALSDLRAHITLPQQQRLPTKGSAISQYHRAWFSSGGHFVMSGSIFGCYTWGMGTIGIQKVEAKEAGKHSTMHKLTPTTKNYVAQMSKVLRLKNTGLDFCDINCKYFLLICPLILLLLACFVFFK